MPNTWPAKGPPQTAATTTITKRTAKRHCRAKRQDNARHVADKRARERASREPAPGEIAGGPAPKRTCPLKTMPDTWPTKMPPQTAATTTITKRTANRHRRAKIKTMPGTWLTIGPASAPAESPRREKSPRGPRRREHSIKDNAKHMAGERATNRGHNDDNKTHREKTPPSKTKRQCQAHGRQKGHHKPRPQRR